MYNKCTSNGNECVRCRTMQNELKPCDKKPLTFACFCSIFENYIEHHISVLIVIMMVCWPLYFKEIVRIFLKCKLMILFRFSMFFNLTRTDSMKSNWFCWSQHLCKQWQDVLWRSVVSILKVGLLKVLKYFNVLSWISQCVSTGGKVTFLTTELKTDRQREASNATTKQYEFQRIAMN